MSSGLLRRLLGRVRSRSGEPHKLEAATLRECVGRDDPTILEIGSNDGTTTLWFLEIFRQPRIYCFEPDPRAASRFRQKVPPHANVTLAEIALGNRIGRQSFFQSAGTPPADLPKDWKLDLPQGWDLSGSIRKPKQHLAAYPWVRFDRQIEVPISTLDAWAMRNGIVDVDFIWMDAQGAEQDVVQGGQEVLARTRFLYTEYSDSELYEGQASVSELLRLLPHFDVIAKFPGDMLLRNRSLAATAS